MGAFEATPSFASAGGADVAALVEAALMTRLEATGCCKAVEREAMAPLVTTMGTGGSAISSGAPAPPPDEVLPAQFIIAGSVTINPPPDLGYHTEDGAPRSRRDSVEIDVRFSDARSAMVLGAFQAERRLSANSFAERSGTAPAPNRTGAFLASPLGQATDLALADIVTQIVGAMAALPWRGQIVRCDGGLVWVNAGSEDGVSVGDRFGVGRFGDGLVDPAIGGVVNKVQLGVVTITDVEPRTASGAYQRSVAGDPARGDWLVVLPR